MEQCEYQSADKPAHSCNRKILRMDPDNSVCTKLRNYINSGTHRLISVFLAVCRCPKLSFCLTRLLSYKKIVKKIYKYIYIYIYIYIHSRELKTLHQKIGILGFCNIIMTLIFIYKTTNTTWLPFLCFFFHHILRLVCDVTCYVIFIMRLWLIVRNFLAMVLMKLNA